MCLCLPPPILQIKYWLLPFVQAAVDVLQAQNPLAALPHALGILTGAFKRLNLLS